MELKGAAASSERRECQSALVCRTAGQRPRAIERVAREAQHVAVVLRDHINQDAEKRVDVLLQHVNVELRAQRGEAADVDEEEGALEVEGAGLDELAGVVLRELPERELWRESPHLRHLTFTCLDEPTRVHAGRARRKGTRALGAQVWAELGRRRSRT